jgi:hypothetical protein
MAKMGVPHAGARAIMELVAWVSKEYGDKCWHERNMVELVEGRGVVKENQRRARLMREEGAEIAGKLGGGAEKVRYHFGNSQRVSQVKKRLNRVKELWKEVNQRVASDGQMRIDQMVVGCRVDTVAGKKRGGATRKQRWNQQQLSVGPVSTREVVGGDEGESGSTSGTGGGEREEERTDPAGAEERQIWMGREDSQQRSGRKRSQPPQARGKTKKSKKSRNSSETVSAPSDGAGQSARQGVRLITELLVTTAVGLEGPEPLDTG